MKQKQHHAEFVANLQLEQDAIKTFIEILEKEQNALVHGNIEDLDYFASQKTLITEKLADFGNKRDQYLAAKDLSLDTKCVNNLLTSEDNNTAIGAAWNELLQLAKTAKQLNQTNGTIITTRLQQSQQALAALQSAAGTVSLYGPKGQTMAISD
jgi:flagellar biosynthesis protein FlgN